jgi:hypothetical protein
LSWIERLEQACGCRARPSKNSWDAAVKRVLPGKVDVISTNAICDLLDVPATTGNARRIAESMRAMGFVPIKSRRLTPGGFRDTTIRGWARPERLSGFRTRPETAQSPALAPTRASDVIRSP